MAREGWAKMFEDEINNYGNDEEFVDDVSDWDSEWTW